MEAHFFFSPLFCLGTGDGTGEAVKILSWPRQNQGLPLSKSSTQLISWANKCHSNRVPSRILIEKQWLSQPMSLPGFDRLSRPILSRGKILSSLYCSFVPETMKETGLSCHMAKFWARSVVPLYPGQWRNFCPFFPEKLYCPVPLETLIQTTKN